MNYFSSVLHIRVAFVQGNCTTVTGEVAVLELSIDLGFRTLKDALSKLHVLDMPHNGRRCASVAGVKSDSCERRL